MGYRDILNRRGINTNEELFDLTEDPNELANLVGDARCAATQRELSARLWRWMESVDDPLLEGPVASPSYEKSVSAYRAWKSSAS